ncbi:aldo/keto reductase [Larkinella knui]|uniref:Aldo/keto reductase n=1 Tax=Larkinella knui TaxID=2025310 RepID=A0A3P1CWR5_9BACT|nr:aldo/keto reductase [Larkinella knui]RRB17526.1 aldo/keto reductase [Larkinella knui]
MEYRILGDSDVKVSAIAFGAWAVGGWMWGGTERNDAVEAIKASFDLGVTSIDTAPVYGQGTSEEIVGEAIKGLPRDQVQILTKYGMRWDLAKGTLAFHTQANDGTPIDVYKYASKESIMRECEASLKRLGTDYIDLYQIHWPDVTTPISESMEAVGRLIEQGKVRAAGVCNYSVEQMKEAERTLKLVSNQVPFSMVKRDIEADLVPYCLSANRSILAYSPLERGLLAGKIKPGHQFAKGDHRATYKAFKDGNSERVWSFLAKIRPIAEQKQVSLSQLVIRWTIDRPGITVALVGARNAEQAVQNAKAIEVQLTAEETTFINEQLNEVELN